MNNSKLFYICMVFILSTVYIGCATPGWLKPVHWKKEKTPLDYAIDHYELGQKYEAAGNRGKAIEEYQTSLQYSPRPIVCYKLGLLYAAEGDYTKAKTNLEKAIELSPTFEDAKKELETLSSFQNSMSTTTTSTDTTSSDTTSQSSNP